jgi:protein phosphatase
VDELLGFCKEANNKICQYGIENDVESMGTTAALLAFTKNEIFLCNIGDSKIFRFADEKLEQISVDHYIKTAYGKKPPLSQNLGIPESELAIAPYFAKGHYNDGDIYLLCSDGLTDMVTVTEIRQILIESTFEDIATKLLKKALQNGGKDNITIIVCKVKREKYNWIF